MYSLYYSSIILSTYNFILISIFSNFECFFLILNSTFPFNLIFMLHSLIFLSRPHVRALEEEHKINFRGEESMTADYPEILRQCFNYGEPVFVNKRDYDEVHGCISFLREQCGNSLPIELHFTEDLLLALWNEGHRLCDVCQSS